MHSRHGRVEKVRAGPIVDIGRGDETIVLAKRADTGDIEVRVRVDQPRLAAACEILREDRPATVVASEVQQLVAVFAEADRRKVVFGIEQILFAQCPPVGIRRIADEPARARLQSPPMQTGSAVPVGNPRVDAVALVFLIDEAAGMNIESRDAAAAGHRALDQDMRRVVRHPVENSILILREFVSELALEQNSRLTGCD